MMKKNGCGMRQTRQKSRQAARSGDSVVAVATQGVSSLVHVLLPLVLLHTVPSLLSLWPLGQDDKLSNISAITFTIAMAMSVCNDDSKHQQQQQFVSN